MILNIAPGQVILKLSARDTQNWAERPGAAWPCSTLAGKRFVACFDRNGLCDLTINGRYGNCDGHELNAITCDFLRHSLPKDHECWFVCVGQFLAKEKCEQCGNTDYLSKVKYADETGVGSMRVCDSCREKM